MPEGSIGVPESLPGPAGEPRFRHNMAVTPSAWPGSHQPLGASWSTESTNFAVSAPEATGVELCLFGDPGTPDGPDSETRYRLTEQTLGIWHGAVPGLAPGQRYGFRVDGPWEPTRGRLFNPAKLLLDPYAQAVSGSVDPAGPIYGYRRPAGRPSTEVLHAAQRGARCEADSAPYVAKSVVVDDRFDWGDDDRSDRGTAGPTRSSTSCTSRGSPGCTRRSPRRCAAPTPASPPTPRCTTSRTSA